MAEVALSFLLAGVIGLCCVGLIALGERWHRG